MIPDRADRPPRFDADEVKLGLRADVPGVARALGYDVRGRRGELECARCPYALHGRQRSMLINARTGRWHCKPCSAPGDPVGGDMIDLVAATFGLDTRRDFAAVLAHAASICGVSAIGTDPHDAAARRREVAERASVQREIDRRAEEAEAVARDKAIGTARALWAGDVLSNRSPAGEMYLRDQRKIDPALLIAAGVLRFRAGAPTVALHGSDGLVRNIVSRMPHATGDEAKVRGLRHAPTAGTLVGHVEQIVGDKLVVITEGVIDSLVARLAWPDAVILGAHGAGNYATIARVAAPRVRLAGGRMLLVVHDDDAGARAAVAAGRHAIAAGLSMRRSLNVLEELPDEANDLADAWALGWRPSP